MSEFNRKISSIPESEPLFVRIKARTIKIAKIKDKSQQEYWQEMKNIYKIPQIYLSVEEIDSNLKEALKKNGIKKVLWQYKVRKW